jgi:agmatine deiminase
MPKKKGSMESVTPKSMGYHFPAEWEIHEATWLTYPQNPESWPENHELACKEFNLFVKAVSKNETVHINVNDGETLQKVAEAFDKTGCNMKEIVFHIFMTDDCWCRDHGPAFLINIKGERALVDWEYNAWGNKYPSSNDNQISSRIAQYTGYKRFLPGIVMEGGSIEVNGMGTLLTTKACLLNNNRNPHLSQVEIEEYLRQYYCIDQVIWFDDGIAGDDTDGHIDDIARFADPNRLLLAISKDKSDINYETLQNNLAAAKQFRLINGDQPTIIELPMPETRYLTGVSLPASYANFYICNAGVIVPVFNCKQDQQALDILAEAFPSREIIPVESVNIIYGLGSWHCLSQQEPGFYTILS